MKRITLYCLIIFAALLPLGSQAQSQWNQWTIDAGPLHMNVYISDATSRFIIIDQMSQSSDSSYIDYFEKLDGGLSKEDKDLLARHSALSKDKGWRLHFFYTPLDMDSALNKAVKDGVITEEEAQIEKAVFDRFDARIDKLMGELKPSMVEMAENLAAKKSELTDLANKFSHFTGTEKQTVDIYLVPVKTTKGSYWSNTDFGNGIIAIWGGSINDLYYSLAWDVCGVYLATKSKELGEIAHSLRSTSSWTFQAGISYAYSPGMLGDAGLKRLTETVSRNLKNGMDLNDSYTAATVYGLALQPILKQALEKNQTLEQFLPKAADVWRALQSLSTSMVSDSNLHDGHDYRTDPTHSFLVFGNIGWDTANALAKKYGYHLFGRYHSLSSYQEIFGKISKPDDTVILLLSLDDTQRVPAHYSDLLPMPWQQIESQLKQGKSVVSRGRGRDMNVLLIASPTRVELRSQFEKAADNLDLTKNPLK